MSLPVSKPFIFSYKYLSCVQSIYRLLVLKKVESPIASKLKKKNGGKIARRIFRWALPVRRMS